MDANTDPHSLGRIPLTPTQITQRPLSNLDADKAAVRALVQAAVNVELFTIPLYMCTMKSIQGTHAINASGISYYKGRVWPGRATGPDNNGTDAAQTAYNLLFSVFIDEMLHLQMAANLCVAVGVAPTFNSPMLQDQDNHWICYGPNQTKIPHIIDLCDLDEGTVGSGLTVALADLTENQVNLFAVIEEDHNTALAKIKESARPSYFPAVPFDHWTDKGKESDLPMFGTIGWMYYCLFQYFTIKYADGSTLWEKVFVGVEGQRDLFNRRVQNHPKSEYPELSTRITAEKALFAAAQAFEMMFAICDQGEGGIDWRTASTFLGMVHKRAKELGLEMDMAGSVFALFRPNEAALEG